MCYKKSQHLSIKQSSCPQTNLISSLVLRTFFVYFNSNIIQLFICLILHTKTEFNSLLEPYFIDCDIDMNLKAKDMNTTDQQPFGYLVSRVAVPSCH